MRPWKSPAKNLIARMSATVENVAKASEELLTTANETSGMAKQGGQVVRGTLDGMKNIQQTSNAVAEKIKELSVHSAEIGSMVKAIDDIASITEENSAATEEVAASAETRPDGPAPPGDRE